MAWIVGIIILILLVVSAGFRKFAGTLVAIAVIAGFLYYQYEKREEKLSMQRIPISEITFQDVILKPSYSSYELVGRITNNSKLYSINEVQLKLTFRDCVKNDESKCVIFAEENEHIYINIPPKQARDFKEGIYLYSDLKVKGKLVWDYQVVYTKAK